MGKADFLKALGDNIVKLRSEKNWSQSDLARACFKDRQSIERIEQGRINSSIFYLKEIADGLEVSIAKLLEF